MDSKLTETDKEEEKDNQSIEKQEEDALVLWDCVSMFDTLEEGSLKQEEISETNVTTRSQVLVKEDKSILPKIKKLQENMKKVQKNTTTDKIPEFIITSQDPKRFNMPVKPIEDKVDNVKENLKAPEMGYKLLKTLEVPEEELPTNNQPVEEIVEASVGGKTRFKTPPFLPTLEILNHNVHNCLVD